MYASKQVATVRILTAVLALVSGSGTFAGMGDPESMRGNWKERAEREWNSEKQREWRREQEGVHGRDFTGDKRPESSDKAPSRAPAAPYKTTYLREVNGGLTIVQSNANGSTVSHLNSAGIRTVPALMSSGPRHAEYVDMQQRGGAEVISKERAERVMQDMRDRASALAREANEQNWRQQAEENAASRGNRGGRND